MTTRDRQLLQAAMAAVRDCADTMEAQAASLLQALLQLPMDEELRANARERSEGLRDASSRVTFELALLQTEIVEGKTDTAAVIQRLTGMDALMMSALGAMADVADELEKAAERDEQNEPAFVLVIESTGVLLQDLEQAKSATQALSAATSNAFRK
jgi:CRISPR/Cas system-associated endonuclease Cas3-HD